MEVKESFYSGMRNTISRELTRLASTPIFSHNTIYAAIGRLQQEKVFTEQFAQLLSSLYTVCSFTSQERQKIDRLREVEWAVREGQSILAILKKVPKK